MAVLAALPRALVEVGWLAGSALVAVWGLRLVGLSTRWAFAALLWPPFFQGLYVDAQSRRSPCLPPRPGLAPVWSWRRRSSRTARSPCCGSSAGAAHRPARRRRCDPGRVALVTLPLVGIDAWRAWIEGLRLYAISQPSVPALGLASAPTCRACCRWSPRSPRWAGPGSDAGLDGLARFGVATVVGSPSLFAHGFLVALPAFLALRPVPLWLALGITSVAPGLGWWLAIVLVVAASVATELRRSRDGPWPDVYGTV